DRLFVAPRLAVRVAREPSPGVTPGFGGELLGIAEHAIDLRHVAEAFGLDLGGATGDHDPGARPFAPQAADRLARLAGRLRGHRAGVDHDGVCQTGGLRMRPDDL